jgi:two-component system alkaline phosphatase synthesis response regulator PhoP
VTQRTILVVEDDDNILELMIYHLGQGGFTVQQTFTGEEALERVFVGKPDLILLDLMLPGMGGLEVCATLKNDMTTRSIPIAIVSARGADTDVMKGLEAGADDYLVKPFLPTVLMSAVESMLHRDSPAHRISN